MMSTCEKIGALSSDHELAVKYKYNFQIMNHEVNVFLCPSLQSMNSRYGDSGMESSYVKPVNWN